MKVLSVSDDQAYKGVEEQREQRMRISQVEKGEAEQKEAWDRERITEGKGQSRIQGVTTIVMMRMGGSESSSRSDVLPMPYIRAWKACSKQVVIFVLDLNRIYFLAPSFVCMLSCVHLIHFCVIVCVIAVSSRNMPIAIITSSAVLA